MPEVRLIDANSLKHSRGIAGDEILHEIIDNQPTIEAEPVRHGRWLPIEADGYADGAPVWDKGECSECGHEHDGEEDTLTDYCPDCGRKMYVDDDSGSGVGQTFSSD